MELIELLHRSSTASVLYYSYIHITHRRVDVNKFLGLVAHLFAHARCLLNQVKTDATGIDITRR